MQYRDALDSSKNCPRCCSQTLDRFLKKADKTDTGTVQKTEKITAEAVIVKKKQSK